MTDLLTLADSLAGTVHEQRAEVAVAALVITLVATIGHFPAEQQPAVIQTVLKQFRACARVSGIGAPVPPVQQGVPA